REEIKSILKYVVKLTYNKYKKTLKITGKVYYIENNLPKMSDTPILHIRSSSKHACYYNNDSLAMELPAKSKWFNRPAYLQDTLTDFYMTKQAWWLNSDYMYKQ